MTCDKPQRLSLSQVGKGVLGMQLKRNPIKHAVSDFFRRVKAGQTIYDELSLFLIFFAFLSVFVLMIFNLHRFAWTTWIPLLVAYWRIMSQQRAKRQRENQIFVRYYYPVYAVVKNYYRRITRKQAHVYFPCKECQTGLRIPKKTGHIKITCPKCQHSFVKKTIRGYFKKLTSRVS